uniref:Uncharacterized protein n=1 Tax=Globodera rostochiensis TaxID=31243 RepID=A0A914GQD3_GLORO
MKLLAMAEHFLARLHTLMEMRKISICEIGINLDFVKTLQNILSTEQLDFLPRTKGIPTKVNSQLFKLLLSLAIRLSVQFEHEDLAGDYLNTFIFAYQCITVPKNILEEHCFLKTQITKLDQRIEAKIPILNRDFLIYYSNEHLETIKVKNLLEQIAAEDENISTDEFIGILIGHLSQLKMELCKQNSKKREINKYFDENLLSYAKAIKVNSNIGEGLHQIICVLIGKVKEMVQKREWNYANLKYEQMLEWTLLKIVLSKIGLCGQWKQIEILRGQWAASFDQKYFAESCGESTPNFEEFMQKLVDNLEKIDKML